MSLNWRRPPDTSEYDTGILCEDCDGQVNEARPRLWCERLHHWDVERIRQDTERLTLWILENYFVMYM